MPSRTCFVIIGYGKKPSYAGGRVRMLDLNETWEILIRPVFEALGIECYRAIDKNLSGSIDRLMLREIKNADIALVDISTLNANVMWELGVRHALKPHHTIMICEKEQMSNIPFDISSFVVHQYVHAEEGIPYKEVERFQKHLTSVVKGVLQQNPPDDDSPVFTFLREELSDKKQGKSFTKSAEPFSDELQDEAFFGTLENTEMEMDIPGTPGDTFAQLMDKAEAARLRKDFIDALLHLTKAETFARANMALRENLDFILCRKALCTYKSKQPTEADALRKALAILEELRPASSQDPEVLGLSGAVHKRLFELSREPQHLEEAIKFYENGFRLRNDYYNGINAVFMLHLKAALQRSNNQDTTATLRKAEYICLNTLETAEALEATPDFEKKPDAVWILFTLAEAHNYLGNSQQQAAYEEKARQMAARLNDNFAPAAYLEQKNKIEQLKGK